MGSGKYIYFDGLHIPQTKAISIAEDGTSQSSYQKRMLPVFRTDLHSQIELDELSASLLSKMKDPLQTLKCIADGQTGNLYNTQTVSVIVPGVATVDYRIQMLHHSFSDENLLSYGKKHITEYYLLKQLV